VLLSELKRARTSTTRGKASAVAAAPLQVATAITAEATELPLRRADEEWREEEARANLGR